MWKNNIHILTGPIRTGKSTGLLEWVAGLEARGISVGGYLTADLDDMRYLQGIRSKEWYPFQTLDLSIKEELIEVGRFTFFKSAFDDMEAIVKADRESGCDWIVIDELGKLELREEGAYETILAAITSSKQGMNTRLLIVVRDYLLEGALEQFGLEGCNIIKLSGLSGLT